MIPKWKVNWLVKFIVYYKKLKQRKSGINHTDKQIAEFFLMEEKIEREKVQHERK